MNPHPKPHTDRDPKYLAWLRTQPCANPRCQMSAYPADIVPTHKGGGMALKGSDLQSLPLCFYCHAEEHRGAVTFWRGIDRDALVSEHRKRYEGEQEWTWKGGP